MSVAIEVIGKPAPKGSFRIGRRKDGGPRVLPDCKRTRLWGAEVAVAARRSWSEAAPRYVGEALSVTISFRFRRPAGHWGRRGLRPSAPPFPAVKPDIDKLVRATLDPLEGIVFDNDSRIVEICASKRYLGANEVEGAVIYVRPMGAL